MGPRTEPRRILIVDDEPGIRRLLAAAFSKAGYHVRVAADGFEAVAACRTESFDVMLSDVRMPGLSGHELVRTVVVDHPETRYILMSGFDDLGCEGCGMAPRPCALLSKPFLPKHAVRLVEEELAGSPARQLVS